MKANKDWYVNRDVMSLCLGHLYEELHDRLLRLLLKEGDRPLTKAKTSKTWRDLNVTGRTMILLEDKTMSVTDAVLKAIHDEDQDSV